MSGNNQQSYTTPLLVTVGVVAASSVLFLFWRRSRGSSVALKDSATKYAMPLIEREDINHNTRRFRFGLPSPDHVLGLPIANLLRRLPYEDRTMKMVLVSNRSFDRRLVPQVKHKLTHAQLLPLHVSTAVMRLYDEAKGDTEWRKPLRDYLNYGQMKVVVKAEDNEQMHQLVATAAHLPALKSIVLTAGDASLPHINDKMVKQLYTPKRVKIEGETKEETVARLAAEKERLSSLCREKREEIVMLALLGPLPAVDAVVGHLKLM